jgi:hypothetical protein
MNLLKRLYNYLKGHEKWIEIKLPDYFRRNHGDKILNDEESVLEELRKEEE